MPAISTDVANRNLVPISARMPKAMKPIVTEFQISRNYTRKERM